MANEELIKKAQELGVENAESLTKPQLEKAIKNAEAAIKERSELVARAVELGFDSELLAEFSNEALKNAVSELEEERLAKELEAKKAELMSEFLGVDYHTSTLEELEAAAKNVVVENVKSHAEVVKNHFGVEMLEVSPEELNTAISEKMPKAEVSVNTESEGKTDDVFTTESGLEYVFAEDAPAAFRFADVVRTQKEWIKDNDSMDLMIQGGVSYVKPLKK